MYTAWPPCLAAPRAQPAKIGGCSPALKWAREVGGYPKRGPDYSCNG